MATFVEATGTGGPYSARGKILINLDNVMYLNGPDDGPTMVHFTVPSGGSSSMFPHFVEVAEGPDELVRRAGGSGGKE